MMLALSLCLANRLVKPIVQVPTTNSGQPYQSGMVTTLVTSSEFGNSRRVENSRDARLECIHTHFAQRPMSVQRAGYTCGLAIWMSCALVVNTSITVLSING